MIRTFYLRMVLFLPLILIGCAKPCPPSFHGNLLREAWMCKVDNHPKRWLVGGNRWFLTGFPNADEIASRKAPLEAAMSTMQIKVPDFSKIKVSGEFQVQIFGTYGHNTVYVYGPNAGVRLAAIDVANDTLCINQQHPSMRHARKVIIRVGVHHLTRLLHAGTGSIMAIRIPSNGLDIIQGPTTRGNIYLAGNVNLRRIIKLGRGCITVLGANTPALEIETNGVGAVNVMGHVGIRSIKHHGSTEINIIGAKSDSLGIYADGRGKIGISGPVRIKEIFARGSTCIYAFPVNTDSLSVYLGDNAHVGLTGYAQNLQVNASGMSRFGGKQLCSGNAYVQATDAAHVNVAASTRAYTSSANGSSIYYFGPPNAMTRFTRDVGTVYTFWNESNACPISYTPPRLQVAQARPYPSLTPVPRPKCRKELVGQG